MPPKWLAMGLNSHWFEVSATSLQPAKWLTELVERDLRKGTRYWGVEGRLWSAENPDAYAGVHNFDGVMVMADEPAVRTNRLNLLGVLRNQAAVLADFRRISG